MKRSVMLVLAFTLASPAFAQSGPGGLPLPHQIPFSGYIVKYPKGANQATLERYIPDLRCYPFEGDVICSSPADSLSSLFVRGVECIPTEEVMFTIRKERTVGAGCGVTQTAAQSLAISYRQKYGPPKVDRKLIYSMISDHQSWNTGGEVFTITHWYGSNIKGDRINNFSIDVSSRKN